MEPTGEATPPNGQNGKEGEDKLAIAKITFKQAVLIALIGGLVTIATSALTTYTTIKTSSNKLEETGNRISELAVEAESIERVLPIGTIVSSMLPPTQFRQEAGNGWVLANGRSVTDSRYAVLTGKENIPDLRGMFLRGLNEGRTDDFADPQGNRDAGSDQPQAYKKHRHEISNGDRGLVIADTEIHTDGSNQVASQYSYGRGDRYVDPGDPETYFAAPNDTGSTETRPNNVAVYYYIKID